MPMASESDWMIWHVTIGTLAASLLKKLQLQSGSTGIYLFPMELPHIQPDWNSGCVLGRRIGPK